LIVDPPPGTVTWIKVERPVFDLAGVLVSSLSLTVILAGIALFFGVLAGLAIIRYRRRHPEEGGLLQLHIASRS
jgi:ABC-type spermidine/putrescine transport system permease subunit II